MKAKSIWFFHASFIFYFEQWNKMNVKIVNWQMFYASFQSKQCFWFRLNSVNTMNSFGNFHFALFQSFFFLPNAIMDSHAYHWFTLDLDSVSFFGFEKYIGPIYTHNTRGDIYSAFFFFLHSNDILIDDNCYDKRKKKVLIRAFVQKICVPELTIQVICVYSR